MLMIIYGSIYKIFRIYRNLNLIYCWILKLEYWQVSF